MDDHAPPETGTQRFIRSRGLRIPVDPRMTRGQIRRLRTGNYERKEAEAALRVVGRDDVVMELGAGIGYMSTLIARKRAPRAIHAYEANPTLIDLIRAVHAANGVSDVQVHNALLAAEASEPRPFHVRENFLASSLDPDAAGGVIAVEHVEVRAVNEELARVAPTVLICDIEGAEADLLPAADLSGLRAAIVEVHPQWIGQAGVQAVFDAMNRGGLSYFPKASEGKVVTFRKGW